MNRESLNHSDIWVLVQHREGTIEEASFGLMGEARRIVSQLGGEGTVTAICLGLGLDAELRRLGAYGTDRVLYLEGDPLVRYQGELFAKKLFELCGKHNPTCILAAQTADTLDLCARLAAFRKSVGNITGSLRNIAIFSRVIQVTRMLHWLTSMIRCIWRIWSTSRRYTS